MRVPPDQSTTWRRTGGERLVGIALPDGAGDVGQPRAEQEGGHALARIGDGMQEMQEQPRVLAHRAGNIQAAPRSAAPSRAARDISDRSPPRPPSCWRARCGGCRSGGRAGSAPSRRVRTRSSGSASRAIACLAAAISAAVICAKSFFCSTSRSDTVSRASISTSDLSCALVEAAEQRLLDALRARRRRLWRGCRRAPAASRRSASRYSRACGRKCGTPGRTRSCARAASRTPHAASSRNPRGRRRGRRRALPAHRAPRPARPECRRRAARARSRGCFRRGGLLRVMTSFGHEQLTPPRAAPTSPRRAAPSPWCRRAGRCRPGISAARRACPTPSPDRARPRRAR